MTHCSGVDPNGPAAMACLQRNASPLSPRCQAAVFAGGGGPAGAPAPAGAAVPPGTGVPSGAAGPAGAQSTALAPAPAPEANVAFVEAVSGRVVVFARGKPALLENADVISDGAQLDLQPNSELRICLYTANRLLTLRGPARALVSAAGVVDEAGRAVQAAVGTCTPSGPSR